MKAKDTVMTWKETCECSHNPNQELRERDICEAQAEISFKAGYEQSVLDNDNWAKADYGYKLGMREVMEFIDNLIIGIDNCKFEERLNGDKGCIVLDMNENQWQAFKKERGL